MSVIMTIKLRLRKFFLIDSKITDEIPWPVTYLHVQISKALKTLSNSIPLIYKVNQTNMFTKNMMDFVFVPIEGLQNFGDLQNSLRLVAAKTQIWDTSRK
jgi:hypothetical protein